MRRLWFALAFAGVVVAFGFGFVAPNAMVDAYPFQTCVSSGGPSGYVTKADADAAVPFTHIGVLIDSDPFPPVFTCITINRVVTQVDASEIDERTLINSGETTCPDCITEWED